LSKPEEIKDLSHVTSIAGFGNTSLAVSSDNKLYSWGFGGKNQTGLGDTADILHPKHNTNLPKDVTSVGFSNHGSKGSTETFCDFIIRCNDGKDVMMHRAIILVQCPKLLELATKGGSSPHLDIPSPTLKAVICYLYTDFQGFTYKPTTWRILADVIIFAKKLNLSSLVRLCRDKLYQAFTISSLDVLLE